MTQTKTTFTISKI